MQSSRLEHYRERLIEERRQLVQEMDRIRESIPDEVHPPGEHEIAPSQGVDVDVTLAAADGRRVREIDAALHRIKEGVFGKCCTCGQEISEARLEAIPDALYCVRCAEP
jgi:RNA polymerase-binding protein DksA